MTFEQRVGYEEAKVAESGSTRKCRNTTTDRLRASERAELFTCLNQIGFEGRVIFVGAKPVMTSRSDIYSVSVVSAHCKEMAKDDVWRSKEVVSEEKRQKK